MAGPSVTVRILGDLKGLGQSLSDAGDKAVGVAGRGAAAFKSWLGGINATGALGPLGPMLDGIAGGLDNLTNKAKGVGPAMMGGGAALTGLGAGLSAFGSKQQAAQQQLDQAIQATGHTYDEYASHIDEAIKHGEKFGETADKTQDALRVLTQATHDPQKAMDMLSTAENVAAAKHEDLTTAATQVGKVYNGNTKLLKEYGISIDKTTGLTKDGQTATEALARVTAGQASAAANTFKGKLDALRATATDAVAQFGQKFGPAMQVAGVAMMTFGAMMDAGMGPLLLIIGGIAALIAIGYLLYNNWDTIWAAIQAVISDVWQWIVDHWPLLLDIFLGPFGVLINIVVDHFDQIKAVIMGAVDFIRSIWDAVFNTLSTIVNTWVGRIEALISNVVQWINNVVSPLVDILSAPFNIAVGLISAAIDVVRGIVSDAVGFISGVVSGVRDAIVGPFNAARDLIRTAIDDVRGIVGGIFDAVSAAMAGVEHAIAGPFEDAWNTISNIIGKVKDAIGGIAGIGGSIVSGAKSLVGLQHGGIVTKPTVALIGEAGPEAVVPLNGARATPINSGPSVVIQNANFATEMDVELFMRRAAWVAQTSMV